MAVKNRFLLIDILKIFGIGLVLIEHLFVYWVFPTTGYLIIKFYGLYEISFGNVGLSLFLLASGASLFINYQSIDSWKKVKLFFSKRAMRIYPMYWFALIFAIVLSPEKLEQQFTVIDTLKFVSGFQSLGAVNHIDFWGKINGNLWFLTIILSLYLLYPIITYAINKHPKISLLSLFVISVLSRIGMSQLTMFFMGTYWFPLCWIFEFSLGIFLIKKGIFLKIQSNKLSNILGNMSYYVFLINGPIIVFQDLWSNPILFFIVLFAICALMLAIDGIIKNQTKRFLNF